MVVYVVKVIVALVMIAAHEGLEVLEGLVELEDLKLLVW